MLKKTFLSYRSRLKLFHILILFLLYSSLIMAQVKIKEKVELKNNNSLETRLDDKSGSTNSLDASLIPQTIKIEVRYVSDFTYPPAPWDPDGGDAKIINCIFFYHGRTGPILGYVASTSGYNEFTYVDVYRPYDNIYRARIDWGTTIGGEPSQWNWGNAGIYLNVYVNGKQADSQSVNIYGSMWSEITLFPPPCASAPECSEQPQLPPLKFNEPLQSGPNVNECTRNTGALGYFNFNNDSNGLTYNREQTNVCFNAETGSWQFNPGQVEINTIIGLCLDNINKKKYNLINKSTLNTVPNDKLCSIIDDLEHYRSYPPDLKEGDYVFEELLLLHEQKHFEEFQKYINNMMPDLKLKQDILNVMYNCFDFSSVDEAKNELNKKFYLGDSPKKSLNVYSLFSREWEKYRRHKGLDPENESIKRKQEIINHQKIQDEIDNYQILIRYNAYLRGIKC